MNADARLDRLNVDPPRGGRGPRTNLTRARGQRTREIILEEATVLFSKYGYRGTSLRDISERVGISHPGMLHHFSHKEALLLAVLDRTADQLDEFVEAFVKTAQDPAELANWDAVKFHDSHMFSVVRAEALEESHPGRGRIIEMQLSAERKLADLFTMYDQRGWLVEGVSPDWIARVAVGMWTGIYIRDGLLNDDRVLPDLAQFFSMCIVPLRDPRILAAHSASAAVTAP